jgi:hypothetical protein
MKKSMAKLTSTVLMLILISTTLSAATLSSEEATTRIQRKVRLYIDRNIDRKLSKLDDEFSKEEINITALNLLVCGRLVSLVYGDPSIRDGGRAIQLCKKRLLNDPYFRFLGLDYLAVIYSSNSVHKNLPEAAECYQELVSIYENQPASQLIVLENLLNLYDTEGDDDKAKTKGIIQGILEIQSRDSVEYLEALQRLAHRLIHGNDKIKDIGKAIQILEELCTHNNFKLSNLQKLSNIYEQDTVHRNLSKVIECQLEIVELYADQPLEQLNILARLLKLYNTEGDTFNPDESNNIVQKILAMHAHEGLRGNNEFKLPSLQQLSYIYEHDPVHKNPAKLAECYLELVVLYADKPLEQLNILARLVKLYIAEGAAFNSEEAKTSANRILTDLAADPTPSLKAQVALSDLYFLHSDLSTPEEIIRINTEIVTRASELGTGSLDLINAHRRLIEVYKAQQDIEAERTTYLSLFNYCENASIATECYHALVKLDADQSLKKLNLLARLLKIYIAKEAAFNIEEEKTMAQNFLTSLARDPTAYLETQVALSDLYSLHPDLSTPEEIIRINEELTKHEELKTGSSDLINAHKRLIMAYNKRIQKIHISLIKRCGSDNRAPILQEYNKFIKNK